MAYQKALDNLEDSWCEGYDQGLEDGREEAFQYYEGEASVRDGSVSSMRSPMSHDRNPWPKVIHPSDHHSGPLPQSP